MRIIVILSFLSVILSCQTPIQNNIKEKPNMEQNWKLEVEKNLKQFGHRNWIVIADAAYPEQSNPAIKTITIDESQIAAVDFVSGLIGKATHVDANIFIDKEMAFVPEEDASGIDKYRTSLDEVLKEKPVKTMLHEDIIRELDNSAKLFNVLIIKTDMLIPYTSVFFQLECGYWNAEAEKNMRDKLKNQH